MDETGLYYNMEPDYTIARERIEGSKKDKTRLTIAFTCNADGSDGFKPLFIEHAAKPRCVERKTGAQHGFWYFNNTKAWMTGLFFRKYLQQFDGYVRPPVLLLIDNAPSHITEGLQLRHVKVICLPPNTTSKYQPLDAGIIAAFKKHSRRRQIMWGLDQIESGKNIYKVHQSQAMRWMAVRMHEEYNGRFIPQNPSDILRNFGKCRHWCCGKFLAKCSLVVTNMKWPTLCRPERFVLTVTENWFNCIQ